MCVVVIIGFWEKYVNRVMEYKYDEEMGGVELCRGQS